jgi:hypothetical protein
MIIIAKYKRLSRIKKDRVKVYRTSRLFDPVIWIGRDHCWIPSPANDGYISWQRYIIIWSIEKYIDAKWYEKSSIIPKYKFWLFSKNKHILYFGKNKHQRYDLRRWYIYNPINKFYNINIKDRIFKLINKSKYEYVISDCYNEWKVVWEYIAKKLYYKLLEDTSPDKLFVQVFNRKGEQLKVMPQFVKDFYK